MNRMISSVSIPAKLQDILDMFEMTPDRNDRYQLLIEYAEKYKPVSSCFDSKP